MPKFSITHDSRFEPDQAYEKACELIENESKLRDIDPGYRCQFDPARLSGSAKSRYFKADMRVQENGQGSRVELRVDLPMQYALARSTITRTLKAKMQSEL